MKYLLFLLITFSLYAADKEAPKDETELAVSAIYEKRDEERIVDGNEELKKCKETYADNANKAEECVREIVDKLSDEDIEKLGDKIKLSSYNTKASKSAKTIREYLSERMTNALRGAPKKGAKEITLREMKYVDHSLYSKIYRSQIGKNILLETTNYCISNFGHKNGPEHLVFPPQYKGIDFSESKRKIVGLSAEKPSSLKVINYDSASKKVTPIDQTKYGTPTIMIDWKDAYEYEICDNYSDTDTSKCKYSGPPDNTKDSFHRSSEMIEEFKKAEFDFGPSYMKAKISFCTQTVIKNMCERYRCKSVYDANVSQTVKDNCKDEIGITVTARGDNYTIPTDPSKGDVSGIMACGLMDRLKEYRRVIAALDQIDEINKNSSKDVKGFGVKQVFSGQYKGGKGEKSIEDLTTIASTEFKDVTFVDEEKMAKLREECFQGDTLDESNPDCAELTKNELSEESSLAIRAEMEAETAAYLKRVESLKDNKEGLMEFLKDQGLDKKYADENIPPEELAILIQNQYKSQRAALKKSMMDKYNQTRKKEFAGETEEQKAARKAQDLTEVAKSNIVNMEKEKEKLETLLQYNNILTSYLGATLNSGGEETETTLSYQRQIELDQAQDSGDGEFVDEYRQFFDNNEQAQSTQDANLQVDLNFIDSLLGNQEDAQAILEQKESE